MKNKLKEFMPLLNLVKEEKVRIILASSGFGCRACHNLRGG